MQATSFVHWVPAISIVGVLGMGMSGAIATPLNPTPASDTAFVLSGQASSHAILSSAEGALQVAQVPADVVDAAIAQGSFRTFIQLLSQLGMEEDLRGYGRFTVFAPTDAAFDAVPQEVMAVLAGDRNLLARVLANHIIAAGTPYTTDTVTSSITLRTLQGSEVEIRSRGSSLSIEGHRVILPDIAATNGVIHGIDTLLIPDDLALEIQQQL